MNLALWLTDTSNRLLILHIPIEVIVAVSPILSLISQCIQGHGHIGEVRVTLGHSKMFPYVYISIVNSIANNSKVYSSIQLLCAITVIYIRSHLGSTPVELLIIICQIERYFIIV